MSSTTWNGSTSTDWNTGANWTPSGVPGTGAHIVIADTSGASVADCTLDTTRTIGSLTIQTNGTLIGGGNKLIIQSEGDASGGTEHYAVHNSGIISGNLDLELTHNAETAVKLNGSSGNFQDIKINHADADVNTDSSATIDRTLIIAAGKFDIGNNGFSAPLGHVQGNAGTFEVNNSTVSVGGQITVANVTVAAGSITSNDDFRPTTKTTITGNATITAAGNSQMGGLFDISGSATPTLQSGRLHGTLDIPSGNQGQSTFNLALNEDQTGPSRHLYFYNFNLDSQGTENNTLTLASSFTVTHDMTITDGEFKANGGTVEVNGKTTIGPDSGAADQATLTCDASAMFLGSGKTDELGLHVRQGGTFVGGSGNHTMGSLGVDNNAAAKYTNTSATNTINGHSNDSTRVIIGGSLATCTAAGTITITYAGGGYNFQSGNIAMINNLTLNSDVTANLSANTSISGDLNVTQGTLDTTSSDYSLTVTGDIEIADGGPQLSYNDSTVTCGRLGCGLGGVGKIDGTEAGKIIVNKTGNIRILDLAGAILTGDTPTFEYQGQATTATQALSGLTSGTFNLIVNSDGASEKCIPNGSITALNDLRLTDGEFELPSSTNIEAVGDLIMTGGVGDFNPASSDGNITFRSATISSGGGLEAPSHGSFTLTGTLSAWSFQNNSTGFNHNNGTITQTNAGHIKSVSSNPFYNFVLNSGSSDSHEAVFRPKTGTDCVIAANEVTITRGVIKLLTESHTASMASLTIGNTGTYEASSTSTTISGGASVTANRCLKVSTNGTFTHNGGILNITGTDWGGTNYAHLWVPDGFDFGNVTINAGGADSKYYQFREGSGTMHFNDVYCKSGEWRDYNNNNTFNIRGNVDIGTKGSGGTNAAFFGSDARDNANTTKLVVAGIVTNHLNGQFHVPYGTDGTDGCKIGGIRNAGGTVYGDTA